MNRFFASGIFAFSLGFMTPQAAKASPYVVTYRGVVSDSVDPLTGHGPPPPNANSDLFNVFGLANTNLIGLPFSVSFTIDPSRGYVYSYADFTEYLSTDLTNEGQPPTGGGAGMPVTAVTMALGNTAIILDVPLLDSLINNGRSSGESLDERVKIIDGQAGTYEGVNYPAFSSQFQTRYDYNISINSSGRLLGGGILVDLYTHDKVGNIDPAMPLSYTLTPTDYGTIIFSQVEDTPDSEYIYGRITSVTIDGTAAVPEAGTWGMMLLGVAAVGCRMRRSRKRATLA